MSFLIEFKAKEFCNKIVKSRRRVLFAARRDFAVAEVLIAITQIAKEDTSYLSVRYPISCRPSASRIWARYFLGKLLCLFSSSFVFGAVFFKGVAQMCINKRLKSEVVRDPANFCIQSLEYFPGMLRRLVFNIRSEFKANRFVYQPEGLRFPKSILFFIFRRGVIGWSSCFAGNVLPERS